MLVKNNSSTHIDDYNRDIEILLEVEELLDSVPENNKGEFKDLINNKIIPLLKLIQHPVAAENIFGMSVGHPNTYLRYRLIETVENWLPYFSAVDAIVTLTHDPDDLVSFKAMEVCAEHKIEQALPYLSKIIGDVTLNLHSQRKPVGLGAQKVLKTMLDIFGVTNQEELTILYNYFKEYGILKNNYDYIEDIPTSILEEFQQNTEDGMTFIPGGFFDYGLNENEIPFKTFEWRDSSPRQKVWLPPFFIDKYPITNAEYDEFTEFTEEHGHVFCHPNVPTDKQHRRNTYWDERFKADHPTTGIDFYDAFAFARWKGRELPTEFQWEKAARGVDDRVWPWGNSFEPNRVQYSGSLYNTSVGTLNDWRETILKAHSDNNLSTLTVNSTLKDNQSQYGVIGMVGNTWEWTKSDFITRRMFHPNLTNQSVNKINSYAVLKGGSFFSHPGLMYPSFRGKDIPFCRHNEMGLRCVKNIPLHLLRKAIGKPITNKAIY
jgi:gamma-glutamyl hercynylcysteine S-oxide synthase